MDKLDQIRVRIATEDHAATYHGGPLGLGPADAARYVSEGHLANLCDRHGLGDVWRAVAAVLEANPQLLTDSRQTRQMRARRRAAACEGKAMQAYQLVRDRQYSRALAALSDAEQIDPDHLVDGLRSWDSLRQIVQTKAEPS